MWILQFQFVSMNRNSADWVAFWFCWLNFEYIRSSSDFFFSKKIYILTEFYRVHVNCCNFYFAEYISDRVCVYEWIYTSNRYCGLASYLVSQIRVIVHRETQTKIYHYAYIWIYKESIDSFWFLLHIIFADRKKFGNAQKTNGPTCLAAKLLNGNIVDIYCWCFLFDGISTFEMQSKLSNENAYF